MKHHLFVQAIMLAAGLTTASTATATSPAWFLIDGEIIPYSDQKTTPKITSPSQVGAYFGQMESGQLVLGIGKVVMSANDAVEKGMDLVLFDPNTSSSTTIATDVIRAYPAPVGDSIAIIPKSFDLTLYTNDELIVYNIKERAFQAAWFPHGEQFVYSAYPEGWTSEKMNNPANFQDMLHWSNSSLYIWDVQTEKSKTLTNLPDVEYNAIVSPDGQEIIFVSTATGCASFYSIKPDGSALQQLTNKDVSKRKTTGEPMTPVPLLDKIQWHNDTGTIIYETNYIEMAPIVQQIQPDGTKASAIAHGNQVRFLDDNQAAYVSITGQIEPLNLNTEN